MYRLTRGRVRSSHALLCNSKDSAGILSRAAVDAKMQDPAKPSIKVFRVTESVQLCMNPPTIFIIVITERQDWGSDRSNFTSLHRAGSVGYNIRPLCSRCRFLPTSGYTFFRDESNPFTVPRGVLSYQLSFITSTWINRTFFGLSRSGLLVILSNASAWLCRSSLVDANKSTSWQACL